MAQDMQTRDEGAGTPKIPLGNEAERDNEEIKRIQNMQMRPKNEDDAGTK